MNAKQIYAHVRAGQFHAAWLEAQQGWRSLRWELRGLIVGLVVGLPVLWVFIQVGALAGLLVVPLGVWAWIAAARPEPVPGRVAAFARRAEERRQRAAAKGTFFAKWVWRPVQACLSGAANVTAGIQDAYLRAATTVLLQMYAVCLALALAYVAIVAVLAVLCLLFSMWVIAYLFLDQRPSFGGDGLVKNAVKDSVKNSLKQRMVARTETREDFWGHEYQQHLNAEGNPVGRSETRTDFWGNEYQQHLNTEGDAAGRSEAHTDFWGNPYTQHSDAQGDAAGHSEARENFWGQPYTQHYDAEGNPAGCSEQREDILGNQYTKHEPE